MLLMESLQASREGLGGHDAWGTTTIRSFKENAAYLVDA